MNLGAPLTDEERRKLTEGLGESALTQSFREAIGEDPDRWAEDLAQARKLGVQVSDVRSNPEAAKFQTALSKTDLKSLYYDAPKLAEYLSNPDNAKLSWDEVDRLHKLEQATYKAQERRGYWNNQARGVANTFSKVGTQGASGLTWLAEQASKPITNILDSLVYYGSFGNYQGSLTQAIDEGADDVRNTMARIDKNAEQLYDYQNRASIDRVIENPTLTNVGEFIAEAGPSSIPYLIAAGLSPTLIIGVIGNQVAVDRATNNNNNNNTGLPTDSEMTVGMLASALSAGLERYGLQKIFGGAKSLKDPTLRGAMAPFIAKEVPKAIAREGALEGVQGGIEYLGGAVGTEKGATLEDLGKQSLSEALVGMGFGGVLRSATVVPEYHERVMATAMRDTFQKMQSQEEQASIDEIIDITQQLETLERSPEALAEFLSQLDGQHIAIPAQVIMTMPNAPDFLTEQLDGTNADVEVPAAEFYTKVATNPEWLPFVRPHIKTTREGAMSLTDIERAGESKHLKNMIDSAKRREEAYTEAERIYEQVKDQIVATRRQGESTARQSAELIKSAFVTAQADLKARGIEVSIEELFGKMGLTVKGPAYNPNDNTGVLNQDPVAEPEPELSNQQNFGDMQLEDTGTDAAGNAVTIREPAQSRWDDAQSRLDMVEQMRKCANG